MERFIAFLLALLFGGLLPAQPVPAEPAFTYSRISLRQETVSGTDSASPQEPPSYIRAVWLSQFDMQPVYRDGNAQRDEQDFLQKAETICLTLVRDGFNTVFLQLRPNGDSLYESELYPLSKYIAGTYGGSIEYDAVADFVSVARKYRLSVHGWINPLRLVTPEEMLLIPTGYAVRDWYDADSGQVKEVDGRLYLDPSYPEVRELIAAGAAEILEDYDLDGIHLDDYFYPTTDVTFDKTEFSRSPFTSLGDFRRNNINLMVRLLYETVHLYGAEKLFGIAPAGNLDSLADGYYADAKTWCAEEGYLDYILPQLYFGFENAYCPFDLMVERWAETVTNESVRLWIGLDAAKAVLGSQGEPDSFAGTAEGKTEWIRRKDILSRSLKVLYAEPRVSGYCFFSYSYLYDLSTGEAVEGIREEYSLFSALLNM